MANLRPFATGDFLLLALVLLLAGGARAGYLIVCADSGKQPGPLRVQDEPRRLHGLPPGTTLRGKADPNELDGLVHNLKERNWFGTLAPLAGHEEQTAHVAPGYPWLLAWLSRVVPDERLDFTVRWIQCVLGALAAALYFLFALRAFPGRAVAVLAGLFTALHPFWIVNTAAINDGTLTTFLLALVLFLGTVITQTSGPIASLLYGLGLAGLCLVRAALLPFSFLAVAWLLLRSRSLQRGWLCALLAFLGFANGLAPWTVRNIQRFGEPVPIVDSAYLHLWAGNNPQADGGPLTDSMLASLPDDLAKVESQPARYARLGKRVKEEVVQHPAKTIDRRFRSGLAFFLGADWSRTGAFAEPVSGGGELPGWLARYDEVILAGTLLGMLLLAVLGWRWSYAWRAEMVPATLALLWVPLPYLLGHAEALSGPRLPLDGVLFCLAAFAIACLLPGGRALAEGPSAAEEPREPAGAPRWQ
jgi:4-amino-4-deoxy-L-arabinose transferase-like glycosyltransferase